MSTTDRIARDIASWLDSHPHPSANHLAVRGMMDQVFGIYRWSVTYAFQEGRSVATVTASIPGNGEVTKSSACTSDPFGFDAFRGAVEMFGDADGPATSGNDLAETPAPAPPPPAPAAPAQEATNWTVAPDAPAWNPSRLGPPKAGRFYGWLMDRQKEFGIDILTLVNRKTDAKGFPKSMREWDQEQTDRAHGLVAALFKQRGVKDFDRMHSAPGDALPESAFGPIEPAYDRVKSNYVAEIRRSVKIGMAFHERIDESEITNVHIAEGVASIAREAAGVEVADGFQDGGMGLTRDQFEKIYIHALKVQQKITNLPTKYINIPEMR